MSWLLESPLTMVALGVAIIFAIGAAVWGKGLHVAGRLAALVCHARARRLAGDGAAFRGGLVR